MLGLDAISETSISTLVSVTVVVQTEFWGSMGL
jgi:hypothetical protein